MSKMWGARVRMVGALVGAVLAMAGCGGVMNVRSFTQQAPGRSIAVVSLAINDYQGQLQGWNETRTGPLMASRAAAMVAIVEQHLAQSFNVVPASAFVGNPAYQAVPQGAHQVAVPLINGAIMPVFGMERGDLVRGEMDPGQAQALAAAAGTDFIAVVYAEWGVVTGGFIPTSKALSKTVVTIYDASGVRVAHQRVDERGERTLGALGHVVVDENSIDEWVMAFDRGLARMVQR